MTGRLDVYNNTNDFHSVKKNLADRFNKTELINWSEGKPLFKENINLFTSE